MSTSDRTLGVDATEWAGRLLVTLQFGLLAFMGWRAWVSTPAFDIGRVLAGGIGTDGLLGTCCHSAGQLQHPADPRSGGTLVTSGPYRWIRHPMYTSVLLAAAGAAVMSHQSLDVLLWLALLAVLVAKAGIEERALMVRYPSYQDYKTRTTRFLPWLV